MPEDKIAKLEQLLFRIFLLLLLLIGIFKVLKVEMSSLW